MSLPAFVNLEAYRGDTWAQQLQFLQGTTPINLTGATVAAWAKNGKTTVVLEVGIATDPTTGTVTLSFVDPSAVAVGQYNYDVEIKDSAGIITTWVQGQLAVVQDITNAA
jgi:hypothetical protein